MKVKVSKWTTLVPSSPGWISREVLTAAIVMNNAGNQVPAEFFDADVFQAYAATFADLSFSAQKAKGFLGYTRVGTKDELYTASVWSSEEAYNAWYAAAQQEVNWVKATEARDALLAKLQVKLDVRPELVDWVPNGKALSVDDIKF